MIPTLQWQTVTGTAVQANGYTIRPISRALALRWHGRDNQQAFGVTWNRPTAVALDAAESRL